MKKQKQSKYVYFYSDPETRPWKPTTLKQKALWVFTLVFWLVGACTVFAIKTDEWMTPQVTVTSAETSYSAGTPAKLPLDCLKIGENGMNIYEIYEGTGWEAGTRVRKVQDFTMDEDGVQLGSGGWGDYVQYASKALTDGQLVEVVRGGDKASDQWLAVFPEGVPELGELGKGFEIVAQSESAVLLSVESAAQPFMEDMAKSAVPALAGARVYSLEDVKRYLGNFVCGGLLLAVFALVFVLWGYAWFENQQEKKYPRLSPYNVILGVILIGGIAAILHFVDLPSSLLPTEHITSLGYYSQEFDQLYQALDGLGDVEVAGQISGLELWNRLASVGIMLVGAGLGFLLAYFEDFLSGELFIYKMRRENPNIYTHKVTE